MNPSMFITEYFALIDQFEEKINKFITFTDMLNAFPAEIKVSNIYPFI